MERCPQPAALEAFATGTSAPEIRSSIEQHLDRCHECAGVVGQLANLYGSASMGPSIAQHEPAHLRSTAGGDRSPHGVETPRADGPVFVGRYELGRRLGSGGMGVVFAATDPELRRHVAIKLLHPSGATDPEVTRARLLREARAMARLAHPNVVAIHDVGRSGEQVFVAMEMIEGTTLTEWLAAAPRSADEICSAFAGAGTGLAAAHEVGLVHRDFKPDNVLIGSDGRARVTDFGLATPALSWSPDQQAPSADLGASVAVTTAGGSIIGTPAYMAPEQWRGETADARSDQFSFCVALFEALTTVRPFLGTDWMTLSQNVLGGRIRGDRSLPRRLDRALRRGLRLDPAQRHRSMHPLLGLLNRDRNVVVRVAAIAGGVGFAAAAAVGVFAWMASETNLGREAKADPSPVAAVDGDVEAPTEPPAEARDGPRSGADACRAKRVGLSGTWSPTRRTNLEQRLANAEHAETILPATVNALEHLSKRYDEVAAQACAEAHPQRARRFACLDAHASRVDGLLSQAMAQPTFRVIETIALAVHQLPDPGRCGEDAWLAAWPAPPTRTQSTDARMLAASVAALEGDLALLNFNAVKNAGSGLIERANKVGDPTLLARAELALGRMEIAVRHPNLAIEWLDAAATHAAEADRPFLSVDVANAQMLARGVVGLRHQDAQAWEAQARGVVQRLPAPARAAEASLARGRVLRTRLELLPALAELDKATELYAAAFGDKSPRLAEVLSVVARVHLDLDNPVAAGPAATRAAQLLEAAGGIDDPRLGRVEAIRAEAALVSGDLRAAAAHAKRADTLCAGSSSLRLDFDRGDALIVQARIDAARGDAAAASESLRKAAIYHYQGTNKALPLMWRGRIEAKLDSAEAGLEGLGAAVVELSSQLEDPGDPRRLEAVRALGLAQLEAGQSAAARKTLDWAVAIARTHFGFGAMNARSSFDLARLEQTEGHLERALKLFDDGHVPWVSAFGMRHPTVTRELLARADLAHALGKSDYAGRLYRTNATQIAEVFGRDSPEAARTRARRADPD